MKPASEHRLPFEAPIYDLETRLAEMEATYAHSRERTGSPASEAAEQIRGMRKELVNLKRTIFASLEPWQTVQVSRHPNRPQSRDYLELVFGGFVELHGDRAVGDDQAIVTGFAHLGDDKVLFVGHQKGKNLAERTACNFGCAIPRATARRSRRCGWRPSSSCRSSTFIDTPGAYPGHRGRGARPGARDRREPDGDEPDRHADRRRSSSARGARAAHLGSAWATGSRCSSTRITRSSARRAVPRSSGRAPSAPPRPRPPSR